MCDTVFHALAGQLFDRVLHSLGSAVVAEAASEAFEKPHTIVSGSQQQ